MAIVKKEEEEEEEEKEVEEEGAHKQFRLESVTYRLWWW